MDDLFYELVKNAHATDILRLGLVSETTRRILQQHWPETACQKYLCNGSSAHCWVCEVIVCNVSLPFRGTELPLTDRVFRYVPIEDHWHGSA